ncbi:MAG: 2-oxo acid dehydrogenase subunit E2 [Asticcacaulis sp.]
MGRFVFKLPDVGEGTAEAELVAWHVAVGDTVSEDQHIADVMTDKATVELTAPVSGKVIAMHGAPGDMRAVGSALIEFEVEGSGNAAAAAPAAPVAEAPIAAPVPAAPAPAEPVVEAVAADGANYAFKLPDVGEGTAEAELVAWHVAVGDIVSEDQHIADVMTDKATVELTAPVSGTVVALNGQPGQMLAVGSPLILFKVDGAGNLSAPVSAPAAAPAPTPAPAPSVAPAPALEPVAKAAPAPVARNPVARDASMKPLASPAVRKRAFELGIALQFVPGSGPGGRIEHGDLDAYMANGAVPQVPAASGGANPLYAQRPGTTDIKVMGMRRQIAVKMQEAKRRIPHFAYVEEVDMTALEDLRVYLNANRKPDQPKLTVLPFFIRALVKILPDFPQINARYDDDNGVVTRFDAVHCGIAAQTPAGLMVPVIRHAESRDLWDLSTEIARLAAAAKSGKASRDELTGGTITITSLGPLGGIVTTPVINHPEVAIIGPNKIVERPVVQNGQVVIRKMMNLSSSFDHRVVDGYDAADFIQRVKGALENPASLFIA